MAHFPILTKTVIMSAFDSLDSRDPPWMANSKKWVKTVEGHCPGGWEPVILYVLLARH